MIEKQIHNCHFVDGRCKTCRKSKDQADEIEDCQNDLQFSHINMRLKRLSEDVEHVNFCINFLTGIAILIFIFLLILHPAKDLQFLSQESP